MATTAIRVDGLSKRYRRRRPSGPVWKRWETFWALRDISFSVRQGEAFGIIGANGAGKSTLLKILSGITEPTEGRAEIRGRVGALLDVGTGFHPDLSGRDNVYLNGTLLGMSRAEIAARFDEIVAFAEIEPFMDTAVKHFSSGMYVRLAFSVAVHLGADILIADEVFAVGDAAFQSKCLAKMHRIISDGRTVLFVSHNIAVVRSLCSNSILIEGGRLLAEGGTDEVLASYLDRIEQNAKLGLGEPRQRAGNGAVRLVGIEICRTDGSQTQALTSGSSATISFVLNRVMPGLTCSFTLYDQYGQPVTYFDSAEHSRNDSINRAGKLPVFRCEIRELLLAPGRYRINAGVLLDGKIEDHVVAAAFVDVEPALGDQKSMMRKRNVGSAIMHHRWTVRA